MTIQKKTAVFTERFVETVVFFNEKIDMCLQAKGDRRGHSENGAGYIFIDLYID